MNASAFLDRLPRHLLMIFAAGAAGALDWAIWLGWDQPGDAYSSGQVIGFALVAVVIVVALAWSRYALAAVTGMTSGITTAVSLDWSADDASGLWAVGAALIFLGTLTVGTFLAAVTVVGRLARETARRGTTTPPDPRAAG